MNHFIAHVLVGKDSGIVEIDADHVVADGRTLWFYLGRKPVGSLPAEQIRLLLRDSNDVLAHPSRKLASQRKRAA